MRAIGVIPARYASTRLPGKPLVRLAGVPMLERVWRNVKSSKALDEIIIATDDARISEFCDSIGARCAMTPPELPSGTDRIFAALRAYAEEWDIAVNVQGDEPLIQAAMIDDLVASLAASDADVATFATPFRTTDELFDPSCVKVVLNARSEAMYFSRATIPFARDAEFTEWLAVYHFLKHIGIYAYKKSALEQFVALPPSKLESLEKLEQLRLLEQGAKYLCLRTEQKLIGIDTPEDVVKFEDYLNEQIKFKEQ